MFSLIIIFILLATAKLTTKCEYFSPVIYRSIKLRIRICRSDNETILCLSRALKASSCSGYLFHIEAFRVVSILCRSTGVCRVFHLFQDHHLLKFEYR